VTPTVIATVAAVVGPLAAYLVAARRFSGKISNSDATDLWKESSAIREWSSTQIAKLTEHVERLEARVVLLEGSNEGLSRENRTLLRENQKLHGQVDGLSVELAACRRRVTELEVQIG
jgi:predicted RNase H-like nuclease (RuvC/YqgF family)